MQAPNIVTYHFADGTKQVCNINSAVLFDEKGRRRPSAILEHICETTAHDIGAVSYEY